MTTKPSIALADLLEKEADTDLLREMIHHIVERVMQFDVENLCAVGYGERSPVRQNSRNGYRERLWETHAGSIAVKIVARVTIRAGREPGARRLGSFWA